MKAYTLRKLYKDAILDDMRNAIATLLIKLSRILPTKTLSSAVQDLGLKISSSPLIKARVYAKKAFGILGFIVKAAVGGGIAFVGSALEKARQQARVKAAAEKTRKEIDNFLSASGKTGSEINEFLEKSGKA